MKKILAILGIYTAIILILCLLASFLRGGVPVVLDGQPGSYKFLRGVYWFLFLLPTIFLSGITVASGVEWKKNAGNSMRRFSAAMLMRFRNLMFVSLGVVFILTMNSEFFLRGAKNKMEAMRNAPVELNANLEMAEDFLREELYALAWQYAQRAVFIAPKDKRAQDMLKRTKDAAELAKDAELHQGAERVTIEEAQRPLHTNDRAYTVRQLLVRAQDAMRDEKYFEAHYWASLAQEACSGTDTNLLDAQIIAGAAWNALNNPVRFNNDAERRYYELKRKGYSALRSGDSLKAYYIFKELESQILQGKTSHRADPDVTRFLALANEDVESRYFFFDETENMAELENSHNIYFSIVNKDSTRLVVFIKGAMDIRRDGGLVRYLNNLTVVTFSKNGEFIRAMNVPFAKVISQSVSDFDKETQDSLGILPAWKTVPSIILQSVDRETEGLVSRPEYSYSVTGLSPETMERFGLRNASDEASLSVASARQRFVAAGMQEPNVLILPMPYSDFVMINEVSRGANDISLPTLNSFISKAPVYGFSSEIFAQSLVNRSMYPFFILILCIFSAIMGWMFRIEDERMIFRLGFIMLVPVYSAMMYAFLRIAGYLYSILNYVMVGLCGGAAVMVALVVYVLILILFSFLFVSRKA